MSRPDGRSTDELRPVEILPGFQHHPQGSALIKVGGTWIVCAASVEDRVPPFVKAGSGWVTAEYSMLPSATHTRGRRSQGGRDKEIQRLIGRAMRGVISMDKMGERSVTLDCDVLQADGGTRCASITGACVALGLALGADTAVVLRERIAAVSVGIIEGEVRLDLSYEEDSNADVDMNVVMTESGQLVEVQGTAEGRAFSREQLNAMLDMAAVGIKRLCELQAAALEAR